MKEKTEENEEDINDIRRKIKESFKDKGKCNFTKSKDSEKDKNTDSKGKYFKNRVVEVWFESL